MTSTPTKSRTLTIRDGPHRGNRVQVNYHGNWPTELRLPRTDNAPPGVYVYAVVFNVSGNPVSIQWKRVDHDNGLVVAEKYGAVYVAETGEQWIEGDDTTGGWMIVREAV